MGGNTQKYLAEFSARRAGFDWLRHGRDRRFGRDNAARHLANRHSVRHGSDGDGVCHRPGVGLSSQSVGDAAVWASGRMSTADAVGYIVSQLIGGIIGAAILYMIMKGKVAGYDVAKQGLGQNGWSDFGLGAAILAEFVGTLIFTIVILAVTGSKGATPMAGLIIGITLMIVHLTVIPVTGTSVNAARSLGPALFVGGTALAQVWMFLLVPTVAGAFAGWLVKSKTLDV